MPIPKKSQPSDPYTLMNRIKSEFPNLKWSNYNYIDQGWDHEVLILDNKFVFRFPVNPDYLKLLKREIEVLKLIYPKVSIRIPRYEYISSDFAFAGYKYISGESLYLQTFKELDSGSLSIIANELANFLTILHTEDTAKYKKLGVAVTSMKDEQMHVRQRTQKYLANTLNHKDMNDVNQILDNVDDLLNSEQPNSFIHGDIYSTHLLWDKNDNKLGIIDFSDMNIGDPAFDFAELFEYGREFVEKVYVLYKGPKDDSFINRAWIYQCWVGVFMMINHFETEKTSFSIARQTFDRVKSQ